jgi:hypothetical protein
MSSQNNDNSLAIAIGFIGAGVVILGIFIFAVAAFITFIFTILSLCAWNKPLRITKKLTIEPEEARAFVGRGLIGAFLLPAFVCFCILLFGLNVRPDAWNYIVIVGYIAGSLGVEIMMAEESAQQADSVPLQLPPPSVQPRQNVPSRNDTTRPPFRFASWNDEEEFDGRS